MVAFCLLKPPKQAGSREGLGALPVPSVCTHLRFSSCDPGRTLSGRSRLLLYRPECDNSFSCKAVIFPYLEEGWFFKGEGGVLALGWVCFLRLSQLRVPRSAPAKMPGEERLGGVSAHLRPPEPPTSAGRQAGQAPAELLPVSHRYTPSQRAPHFLYHLITPKGCVRQAHPLPSSLPQTLTAPTGTTLPCPGQSRRLPQRLRKKLHISRTAMSCLLFPLLIYDKRKVIRAMKIQSYSSTLASSDREVNAAKRAAK